jgi:hypothetical protein
MKQTVKHTYTSKPPVKPLQRLSVNITNIGGEAEGESAAECQKVDDS